MPRIFQDFVRGLWDENPVFRLLIGLCPTLAVTTSVVNGMAMGLATAFVLICSSLLVSMLKRVIPEKVRIPCFIIIIATFVTIVDLYMNAFLPDIHKVLGLFVPLIIVNCVVLGRAESYASKMPVVWSGFDALGMGLGFTWALMLLGGFREVLGAGSLFGIPVFGDGFTPWAVLTRPSGAFISLGILLAIINTVSEKLRTRAE